MEASPKSSTKMQGVSIITCTNRQSYLRNLIQNYTRQTLAKKELIIIVNNNKIPLAPYQSLAQKHRNVQVFRVDGHQSLGACLNFAVKKQSTAILPNLMMTTITLPTIWLTAFRP